jgi:putative nucleotidyltransferase with HDIG domain
MFRFLKQQRLAARGMSCGKTRLSPAESTLFRRLEEGFLIRAAIVIVAAVILGAFCLTGNHPEPFRHLLYALLILGLAVIHPVLSRDSPLGGNSRLALFLGLILLQSGIGEFLQAEVAAGVIDPQFPPLLAPYALAPLTLSVLLGAPVGFTACILCALLWAVLQQSIDPIHLLLPLAGGLAAVLSTLRVRRRSRLLRAGFYSGLGVWALAVVTGVIGPVVWESPRSTDWVMLGLESAFALGAGILTSVLVSGSLPLLEQCFGITTEISWLEMADLNHPLLRRLSMEAPGTYHHSLAVANLAEACAEKTGGNPTLCRVSAYFHDIGKLTKPEYFTENSPLGGNPHDELTPTMSALVIIAHVKDGVDLGLRNKLNRRLIDIIRQHHGTTLVGYFYRRACRQEQDAREGGSLMNVRPGDIPRVNEESFRYPGPKPRTLEAVILGLADACESASRSLERPTLQRIDDLVHDILQDRINDGQYDEAPVTICQLHSIAGTLVSCLASMLHTRITYRRRETDQGLVVADNR